MRIEPLPSKHGRGLTDIAFTSTKECGVSKTKRPRMMQHSGAKPLQTAPT